MPGNHKKKDQNSKLGNEKISDHMLIENQIADFVTIQLPSKFSESQMKVNKLLLRQYLHNKILHKRVKNSMNFTAIYLGTEQQFRVKRIGRNDQKKGVQEKIEIQKMEESQKPLSLEKSYVVKQKTEINLEFSDNGWNIRLQDGRSFFKIANFHGYKNKKQLQDLKNSIKSSLFNRRSYFDNGLEPLKGILITGSSGTGKSSLVRAAIHLIQQETTESSSSKLFGRSLQVKTINSISLLSKVVGGAEEFISSTFQEMKKKSHQKNSSSILVIQDLHLLFSTSEIKSHTTALAALLTELDIIGEESLIVIGTANNHDYELVSQIKGFGKFEKEIELNLPSHHERLEILRGFLMKDSSKTKISGGKSISEEDIRSINLRMNGFSVGEIKQIIRQALSLEMTNQKIPSNTISRESLESVLKSFKPTDIRELIVEVPEVYWKDIGGYEKMKSEIRKVTQLPLKHPEAFKKFGIQPIKGIMLYGPPGCSKTMMAKAIATESKLNFISVKGPQLFSKYVGDSEKAIRNIFKRARACSPCIIFFDQIDAIASSRSSSSEKNDVSDRVLCQLLNQMDGIQGLKEVIIIAATNRPQILDSALMRPGRFDYMIYISPPDIQARVEIFNIYLSKSYEHSSSSEDTQKNQIAVEETSKVLAEQTEGYTGAEISLICREGVLLALEEDINCSSIKIDHYLNSLKKIRKRLSQETISKYTNFESNLKY